MTSHHNIVVKFPTFKENNYQLFLIFEQFQIDTYKKGGHCIPQIYLRLE